MDHRGGAPRDLPEKGCMCPKIASVAMTRIERETYQIQVLSPVGWCAVVLAIILRLFAPDKSGRVVRIIACTNLLTNFACVTGSTCPVMAITEKIMRQSKELTLRRVADCRNRIRPVSSVGGGVLRSSLACGRASSATATDLSVPSGGGSSQP